MEALSFSSSCHPKFMMIYSFNAPLVTSLFHVSSVDRPPRTTTISTSSEHQGRLPLPEPITKMKTKDSLRSIILNTLDKLIDSFNSSPIRSSLDPTHVLSDNFAPVDELLPTECSIIEGALPSCLNGAYIRNGPNPHYFPQGPYHFFEGDGMLHSLLISQGHATFCSRYVKTYKYLTELRAGSPIFPNIFSGFQGIPTMLARGALSIARVLCGQYDPSKGIGAANVSLAFFGNRLFALGDSDLPYSVRVTTEGDIETIGRHDFDGKLCMNMTSHPKIDGDTGEVFAFRCGLMPPFLSLFWFDATGAKLERKVPITSMTKPAFIHDFAITKKYILFTDIQFGINLKPMAKVPRIGVIPRYAKDDSHMRWFDVPGLNNAHSINAWDEDNGNSIVLIAPNIISVERTLERVVYACIEKVRIDLKTGLVSRFPISTMNLESGVINPCFVGKKNKYGYVGVGSFVPKVSGVVKLDWSDDSEEHKDRMMVGCRMFESGCYGGEPFFVPKENAKDEDDGYIVTYMHDENVGESRFLVLDAKSPTLDIVAAVKLPRRVPYGFHGLFVSENDLKNQTRAGSLLCP